jgi:hypothetical protein
MALNGNLDIDHIRTGRKMDSGTSSQKTSPRKENVEIKAQVEDSERSLS